MNLNELDKACDQIETIARQLFEEQGHLIPAFFVLATRRPDGAAIDRPTMFVAAWSELGGDDKQKVRQGQQRMADILCAEATINIMEAWALEVKPPPDGKRSTILRETDLPIPPSQHPDRIEIVCMRAECRAGVIHRSIQIQRFDDGPPRLAKTRVNRNDRATALIEAETSTFAGYFPEKRGEA